MLDLEDLFAALVAALFLVILYAIQFAFIAIGWWLILGLLGISTEGVSLWDWASIALLTRFLLNNRFVPAVLTFILR
jgi:hypothetical protein